MEMNGKRPPLTDEQQREKIVRSFYRDGTLQSVPTKASKRSVVLEYVADDLFEREKEYTESEVNAKLKFVFEDFCRLRRELVDAGLLEREKDGSVYRLAPKKQ